MGEPRVCDGKTLERRGQGPSDCRTSPPRRSRVAPWRLEVLPPHHVKSEGMDRDGYVRIGSTNRGADRELVDELRRSSRGEAYDEQAMPDLDSEALDFRAASESFAPTRRLRRNDLETLRLVTSHQRRTVPTVGGILLFGKDRERHFPDAWIQAGRFHGSDKSVIVDRMEIRLSLPAAVDAALEFVRKHRSTAPRSGPAVARSAGTCPRLQCARLSSTRWRTPTIRNAAHRYASRSSTIDSRSRIRDCCIRSNRRRPATRRVETPQPRDRPRVPRARPDRAMGKRCSADDCGLSGRGARSAGIGGARTALPGDDPHGANTRDQRVKWPGV